MSLCLLRLLLLLPLLSNGYSLIFIEERARIFLGKFIIYKPPNPVQKSNFIQITLPSLGKTSLKMKRDIFKVTRTNIPSHRVKSCFASKRRLQILFSFKDLVTKHLQSHLVYKIMCDDCNAIYYGLTDRHFKVRSYEHLGKSIRTKKTL